MRDRAAVAELASDPAAEPYAESSRRRLLVLDGAAAICFSALPWLAGLHLGGVADWLVAVGAGLPLAVRRIWPVPVFLVVLVDACAAVPLRLGPTSLLALAFAAYLVSVSAPISVSVSTSRRQRLSAAVIGTAAAVGAAGLLTAGSPHATPGGTYPSQVAFGLVVVLAAWTAGAVVRDRREGARRLLEQIVERAEAQERLRVARDIHDVVAHSIGLIVVQSSVANHLMAEHPEEARNALASIERISRGALGDLRTILRVLRPGDVTVARDGPAVARDEATATREDPAVAHENPVPGLADLPIIIATAQSAGIQVELKTELRAHPPEAVGLSAFRIVQEALTNVLKHAAPTRCLVQITAEPGSVTIEVCDDGPGPGHRSHGLTGGLGIVGMQERAAGHGGTLTAGPRAEGGFAVRAVLPY